MRHVVLLSGGLDSVVTMHLALDRWEGKVFPLFVDYGQKAVVPETVAVHASIAHARVLFPGRIQAHKRVAVTGLSGSSLLAIDRKQPEKGLSESIQSTFVPGRNHVLMALASSLAEAVNADMIHVGLSGSGDEYDLGWSLRGGKIIKRRAAPYPDCSARFVNAVERAIWLGGKRRVLVQTPLLHLTKPQILALGKDLGVDLSTTWSCYLGYSSKNGPCGECQPCVIRARSQEFLQKSSRT